MAVTTQIKKSILANKNMLYVVLAFTIPAIARLIPEVLMGQFLVGFDSIGYYVPNSLVWLHNGVDFWSLLSSAPLIYLLLMGVTSTGASIVITLKVLSPILLGFVGVSVYFYASKALMWSSKKSLLVVPFATLYFVALRISWDMLRSELALVFLFLALIILQKNIFNKKNGVLLSLLMMLVAFTHQLMTVIMLVIVIVVLLKSIKARDKNEFAKVLAISTPAISIFIAILYETYSGAAGSIIGISNNFSSGVGSIASASYLTLVADQLGFLAFCYLPLIPFLIFGIKQIKNDFQLKIWLVWCIIPLLLVVLSPFPLYIGGILPYRWVMLLVYPLAFYAVAGFTKIKWRWYKAAAIILLVILSGSYLILPNNSAIGYYRAYPSYIPASMLQNTVQLSDCQDTVNALIWAKDNMPANSYLLVHQAFYGWATLTVNIDNLHYYGYDYPELTAKNLTNDNPSSPVYLIWWVNGTGWYGQPNVSSSFSELYHSGNIAIYKFS